MTWNRNRWNAASQNHHAKHRQRVKYLRKEAALVAKCLKRLSNTALHPKKKNWNESWWNFNTNAVVQNQRFVNIVRLQRKIKSVERSQKKTCAACQRTRTSAVIKTLQRNIKTRQELIICRSQEREREIQKNVKRNRKSKDFFQLVVLVSWRNRNRDLAQKEFDRFRELVMVKISRWLKRHLRTLRMLKEH